MTTRIRLHTLGRAPDDDSIAPSCYLMDIHEGAELKYRIMTDCGMLPRNAKDAKRSWIAPDLSILKDGKKIDAVRITHVHGDHVGYLPAVVPYLSKRAGIYLTRPSAAMLGHVFRDSLNVNAKRGGEMPFNETQAYHALDRLRIIRKPGPFELLPGVTDYVQPEGHINGACSFTSRIGGTVIHYSGDRCGHDQTGIRGAKLLPQEWRPRIIAGSDCTYGADPDSDLRNWGEEMDRGVELCAAALRQGRPVLFFAFGVHRGPAIAHELRRHGATDLAVVYLDGSCRTFADLANSGRLQWSDHDERLDLRDLVVIEKGHERERIAGQGTYAVISTPGMGGPGGAATVWRRHLLPNPEALVVFTSYVAPGTDGEQILKADAERKATGKEVVLTFEEEDRYGQPETVTLPLRCQVERIRIGSHDSQGKILEWFREYRPEAAVLTHGSKKALDALHERLTGDIGHLTLSDRQHQLEIDL